MLHSAQFTFDMCTGAYKDAKNQGSAVPCTGYGWPQG